MKMVSDILGNMERYYRCIWNIMKITLHFIQLFLKPLSSRDNHLGERVLVKLGAVVIRGGAEWRDIHWQQLNNSSDFLEMFTFFLAYVW